MLSVRRASLVVLIAMSLSACKERSHSDQPATTPMQPAQTNAPHIPVEYYKLPNGLRVVLSVDHSVPVATLALYYHIGMRIEPRNRTGFAHLFEHMMFQGSANLGKNEFFRLVQGLGGVLNGTTRLDYTNFYEAFASNALQTMLWAEADRMKGLAITQDNLTNQQGVVKNEIRGNVLNAPYGAFPWLDVPQYANENWYNAHNFYGDLTDVDAATLEDVHKFFDAYYTPSNAALIVAGDFDPAQAKAWIAQYYSPIAARAVAPSPDVSEPEQTKEKHASYLDKLAPRPALALAYHVPERWTPEYFAFGLLDQLLLQGEDSRLHQDLVQKRGLTDEVSGGINQLGNMFDYQGPMLWTAALIHDPSHDEKEIVSAFQDNIERVTREPVSAAELDRARTKIRSSLYDLLSSSDRFGLVDLLAAFALFDDDPDRINHIETEFSKVTPEQITQVATKYLRATNRTVVVVEPGAVAAAAGAKR
jgi:zinc protease